MPFWRSRADPPITDDLILLVGLGNPGSRYSGTRHNVGFMTIERLAARHRLQFKGSKQRADVARGSILGVPTLLAMPVTFMNESGNAVIRLLSYYHIPVERLIVVCDDLDLPFGTIRIRGSGSAGGQRGLQSIIQSLGTTEFSRLRLGIGRPPDSAVPYVLGRFPPEEERFLSPLLDVSADAIEVLLKESVADAMNRYNRDWLPSLTI